MTGYHGGNQVGVLGRADTGPVRSGESNGLRTRKHRSTETDEDEALFQRELLHRLDVAEEPTRAIPAVSSPTPRATLVGSIAGQPADGQGAEILSRLHKASGQLAGITSMYQDGRCCHDILDQLAAARAAIDGVGLILLRQHLTVSLREAVDCGNTDDRVSELVTTVRRYLRSR